MKIRRLLPGIALPLSTGAAMAGQPAPLSDAQMDQVTAGLVVSYPGAALTSGCLAGGVNCTSTTVTVTATYPVSDGVTGLSSFGSLKSAPLLLLTLPLPPPLTSGGRRLF